MFVTDPAPKIQRKPNRIKVNPERPVTALDEKLESELKAFRARLHAEWWKDTEDWLLGPHIFLNRHQIKQLCHLAHTDPLANIDDLKNNFKWNWMDDHGVDLLDLIHDVYGFSPRLHPAEGSDRVALDSFTGASSSKLPAAQPTETATSDTKPKKLRARTGPGSQRCSACGTLGHKSTFIILLMWLTSKKQFSRRIEPTMPKGASSSRTQPTSFHPIQCLSGMRYSVRFGQTDLIYN